jgi:type III secretion protein V
MPKTVRPVVDRLLGRARVAADWVVPSDLALAAVLVAVVVMMLVPLPAFAIDLLIAVNLASSLALLLVALSLREASRLAALPSLLLVSTVFRLGLNVSTTRLVLLEGDAGRIVEAFGRVVVGGNVVVGFAVFLVLVIVQFVVIAKGAERVAEVAARFTLDALPGKQMSIDADLRAGSLTLEEAQERRRDVERESQLYGALDGAMKFVKGDAVAGLVIVAINIAGGLAVGVLQRGMSLGAAAAHYTVLTVGDGLAAQVPSLLVSTTAGLVVTRVPSGGGGLGGDIAAQVGAQPRALLATGALLGLVALLPGMPPVPFLALGAAAAMAAARGSRAPAGDASGAARERTAGDGSLVLRNAPPVRVRLGVALHDREGRVAREGLSSLRASLFASLGVCFPQIEVLRDESLAPDEVEVAVNGVVAARARLAPNGDAPPVVRVLERVLERVLVDHAPEYVGVQECRDMLDALEATHPALVAEVLPRQLSLAQVADVLRRLVAERVSIRDLRGIFEALATAAQRERDTVALAEAVRVGLRRQITAQVASGRPSLPVFVLAPAVEEAFRDGLRYASAGGPVPLDPRIAEALVAQLRDLEAAPREPGAVQPPLVVPQDIRRHVRAVVECALPDVAVVAFEELVPTLALRPIATIG